jgi:hypothetical protein
LLSRSSAVALMPRRRPSCRDRPLPGPPGSSCDALGSSSSWLRTTASDVEGLGSSSQSSAPALKLLYAPPRRDQTFRGPPGNARDLRPLSSSWQRPAAFDEVSSGSSSQSSAPALKLLYRLPCRDRHRPFPAPPGNARNAGLDAGPVSARATSRRPAFRLGARHFW